MVSYGLRKPRKNLMRNLTYILTLIVLVGCSGEQSTGLDEDVLKEKKYNWRLVTSWPKNYPGLGMACLNRFSTCQDSLPPSSILELRTSFSSGHMYSNDSAHTASRGTLTRLMAPSLRGTSTRPQTRGSCLNGSSLASGSHSRVTTSTGGNTRPQTRK